MNANLPNKVSRNFPYDIAVEEIIWTVGPDGKKHVAPPKAPEVALKATPKPAPEPKVRQVTQIARELSPDGILGINLGITCNLLAAGIFNLPRSLEVLADHNRLGKPIFRNEFMELLVPFMGDKGARNAWDELNGDFGDPSKKLAKNTKIIKGRKLLGEFVPKFISINTIDIVLTKKGTNSLDGGRPCEKWAYIPTEGEWEQLLVSSGLAYSDDPRFNMWTDDPFKPLEILASATSYKAFVMFYKLPVGVHSRKSIAAETGASLQTPKNYAKRLGVKVWNNNPFKMTTLSRDSIPMLPVTVDELNAEVKAGNIPEGRHIVAGTCHWNKPFDYTQGGAIEAFEASANGKISYVDYTANSWDVREAEVFKNSAVEVKSDANKNGGSQFVTWALEAMNEAYREPVNAVAPCDTVAPDEEPVVERVDTIASVEVEPVVIEEQERPEHVFAPVRDAMNLRKIPGLGN